MVAIGQRAVVRRGSEEGTIADRTSPKKKTTSSSGRNSAGNAERTSQQAQLHRTRISPNRQALLDSVADKGGIARDLALSCSQEFAKSGDAEARLKSFASLLVKGQSELITPGNTFKTLELLFSDPTKAQLQYQPGLTVSLNDNGSLQGNLQGQYFGFKAKGDKNPQWLNVDFNVSRLARNSPLRQLISAEILRHKESGRLADAVSYIGSYVPQD